MKAKDNYEKSQKTKEMVEREASAQEAIEDFLSDIDYGSNSFTTKTGAEFSITDVDDKCIHIYIPANVVSNRLNLKITEIKSMLESGQDYKKVDDIKTFFGKRNAFQEYSYYFAIYNEIKKRKTKKSYSSVNPETIKNYVFIIDEINRGEISKIFGELFYSIDPGYRGEEGGISTQYSNLHEDPKEKFYIPENVYIIGTMNDIDRSVDSFDFAMRRRFRFIEIKANDPFSLKMLSTLADENLKNEAQKRMLVLNKKIAEVEDLNENYQIGASYFLKLKNLSFDELWIDYLQPLLKEYIRGMYNEDEIMSGFKAAYGYEDQGEEESDETNQNQG